MTIFNVSLFLPYTVNFHLPSSSGSRASSPGRPRADTTGSSSELYRKGSFAHRRKPSSSSSRPSSSRSSLPSDATLFAAKKANINKAGGNAGGSKNTLPPPLLPSEYKVPEWGAAGPYVQPAPKTTPTPSASILGEQAVSKEKDQQQQAQQLQQKSKPRVTFQQQQDYFDRRAETADETSFEDADWTIEPSQLGNGGLKNAVNSAIDDGFLRERLWVGTLGMPTDALSEEVKGDIAEKLETDHDAITVYVEDNDFDGHYLHFCKTILWPVFHYQIPDNPKSKAYEDHSWVYYVRVNQAFADAIVRNYKRGDIIWIHDYHLLLVPSMVREKLPEAQIGFFLHIAFPSSEVFRCLAVRMELLKGMLGANLIGFQATEYCHHFLQTCILLLNAEATNEGVEVDNHFVNVGRFPIGIDPRSLEQRRQRPDVKQFIKDLKEKYKGKHLIVGRDKVDNIRGVRQKLLAYELFLNKYPEWREKVVLLQVGLTTAEQPELEAVVSDIVTRVNSVHSSLSHQPLVFLRQDISFSQYLALISIADVLMVTSLREGMNLTSHEFIYCQDGGVSPDTKHGALILSEFTGSASLFDGYPFLVNPWNYHQTADAIRDALSMDAEQREAGWKVLSQAVTRHTTTNWYKEFTQGLQEAHASQTHRDSISIPRLDMQSLMADYKKSQRRLFIVDYEGTLGTWGSASSTVVTTPQRAIVVLNSLLEDPRNVVYVMSSRMPEELERMFRQVNGRLGLIAENGCFVREHDSVEGAWVRLVDEKQTRAWKEGVADMIEYFRDRTEGSWVEDRHASLVFHYANSEDQEVAVRHGADCAANINGTCGGMGIHAVNVDGAMIAEPVEPNKATGAALAYERARRGTGKDKEKEKEKEKVDFLLAVGDGRDDEVVFRWANKLAAEKKVARVKTVKLGLKSTEAMSTMTQGVTGVLSCLQKLAAQSNAA